MRYLVMLSVVIFALVLALAIATPLANALDARTSYQQQRYALQLQQERQELERANAYANATQPASIIATYALYAGLIVASGFIGWGLLDTYKQRRQLVRYAGLPVSRAALVNDSELTRLTLLGYHEASLATARNSYAVPDKYAPHISISRTSTPALEASYSDAPALAAVDNVPSFSELWHSGALQSERMILGYGADGAIAGTWEDLYSLAIGGVQNSGKTTTTRFLLAQAAMRGAQFVVCDPHGRAAGQAAQETLGQTIQPLRAALRCDVASQPSDIQAAVQLVQSELQQRISGARWATPLMLVIDEFSTIMRADDELSELVAALLEDVATQGRKFGVYAMLLGQQWHVARAGGGALRSALNAYYVHRMKPDVARQLTGYGKSELPDTLHLLSGEAYLCDTRGSVQRVRIPNTTGADLELVARMLPAPAASPASNADASSWATAARLEHMLAQPSEQAAIIDMPTMKPDCSQNVAATEWHTSALESPKTATPEAARIASMFLAGQTPADIVYAIHGIRSNQGGAYQAKLADVLAQMREGLQVR